MTISDFIAAMEQIAPPAYAEPWDNVGLLAGDPRAPLTSLLLTIDLTAPVLAEALRTRCDTILSYHPPIFQPLKRIPATSVIHAALRHNLAIYSPHTAWDVADGGANDFLASCLDLTDTRPLKPAEGRSTQYKLVTFTPPSHLDKLSNALFSAGAGQIGHYSHCSFRSPGQGTFRGDDTTNPTIGHPGQLETADELRLETIVPLRSLDRVLAALRAAHPYETPAFDLLQLAALPETKGIGRIGRTRSPTTIDQLATRLKKSLSLDHLLVAATQRVAGSPKKKPLTVALCAGAGGELLDLALKEKADVYVTGELRHHDALRAAAAGTTVLCTLHSNSERASLKSLAAKLKPHLKGVKVLLSRSDHDPFQIR